MIGCSSRWLLFILKTKLIGGEWKGFVVGPWLWVGAAEWVRCITCGATARDRMGARTIVEDVFKGDVARVHQRAHRRRHPTVGYRNSCPPRWWKIVVTNVPAQKLYLTSVGVVTNSHSQ